MSDLNKDTDYRSVYAEILPDLIEVRKECISDAAGELQDIIQKTKAGDHLESANLIHALKGASGVCALYEFHEACILIESQLKAGKTEEALNEIEKLAIQIKNIDPTVFTDAELKRLFG